MTAPSLPVASHLMMAPLLLPLLAAGLLMLMSERRTVAKAALGLVATVANLAVALLLLAQATRGDSARAQPGAAVDGAA